MSRTFETLSKPLFGDGTFKKRWEGEITRVINFIFSAINGTRIPELTADPVSPEPERAWVLESGGTYTLKYRTKGGTTKSVVLS